MILSWISLKPIDYAQGEGFGYQDENMDFKIYMKSLPNP